MKKLFTLLFISTFLFTSCSNDGPQGPPGPPGPPGEPGPLAQIIDLEGDFTEANNYQLFLDFNEAGVEVFETDVVLVYLKVGEDGTAGGAPVEVFRLLPQTYYIEGEALQYNFDYTFFDVSIFLDGTADFGNLDPSYTDNQVLRIAIVPGEFAENTNIDFSNFNAVMNALDLQQIEINQTRL